MLLVAGLWTQRHWMNEWIYLSICVSYLYERTYTHIFIKQPTSRHRGDMPLTFHFLFLFFICRKIKFSSSFMWDCSTTKWSFCSSHFSWFDVEKNEKEDIISPNHWSIDRNVNKLPRNSESPCLLVHSLMLIVSPVSCSSTCKHGPCLSVMWRDLFGLTYTSLPLSFSGCWLLLSRILRGAGDGLSKFTAPPLFLHFDLSDSWVVPGFWSASFHTHVPSTYFIFFFLCKILINIVTQRQWTTMLKHSWHFFYLYYSFCPLLLAKVVSAF